MEDRRIFERIDARFPLRFLDPITGKEGKAETLDISANGIGLLTKEALALKTPLELWLDIPDSHEPLYTRGQVAWAKSYPETGQSRIGIQLEKAELMGLARVLWMKNRT